MIIRIASITFVLLLSMLNVARAQTLDTLVDVGGYRLHFSVTPGKGIPILFESGGDNDGAVWKNVLQPIRDITGATLITYDRAGLGKSDVDSSKGDIVHEIEGLETALKRLGYDGDIMVVAHSLGGFYSTLFAFRNPQKVKAMVLIDANHIGFFTDDQLEKMQASARFRNTISIMRRTNLPMQIPVIDMVAERTLFEGTPDALRWIDCHKQFVDASPVRQGIMAYDSGHYIFYGNPQLIVATIVKAYTPIVEETVRSQILARSLNYAITAMNDEKRKSAKFRHSENDLNEWGYQLLRKGDKKNALDVFKLNVSFHPQSANAYDSLADCYEAMGENKLAIRNYKRALELDPKKAHAVERLKSLAPNDTTNLKK